MDLSITVLVLTQVTRTERIDKPVECPPREGFPTPLSTPRLDICIAFQEISCQLLGHVEQSNMDIFTWYNTLLFFSMGDPVLPAPWIYFFWLFSPPFLGFPRNTCWVSIMLPFSSRNAYLNLMEEMLHWMQPRGWKQSMKAVDFPFMVINHTCSCSPWIHWKKVKCLKCWL